MQKLDDDYERMRSDFWVFVAETVGKVLFGLAAVTTFLIIAGAL